MNQPAKPAGPDTVDLFSLFPASGFLAHWEHVPADKVPPPYHGLLVHDHHMTVTVEEYHRSAVNVVVLEEIQGASSYSRKILLVTQEPRRVVQFGLVRIHLQYCTPAVSKEILSRQKPLGRILISHNVLRRIEPKAYLRVVPGPALMKWFEISKPLPTYGRQALIHCDGKPAIELVEIVAPEGSGK